MQNVIEECVLLCCCTQGNNGSCVLRDEISPLLGGKQLSCIDFIWKLSEKMKKLKRRELRTDLCF